MCRYTSYQATIKVGQPMFDYFLDERFDKGFEILGAVLAIACVGLCYMVHPAVSALWIIYLGSVIYRLRRI